MEGLTVTVTVPVGVVPAGEAMVPLTVTGALAARVGGRHSLRDRCERQLAVAMATRGCWRRRRGSCRPTTNRQSGLRQGWQWEQWHLLQH